MCFSVSLNLSYFIQGLPLCTLLSVRFVYLLSAEGIHNREHNPIAEVTIMGNRQDFTP